MTNDTVCDVSTIVRIDHRICVKPAPIEVEPARRSPLQAIAASTENGTPTIPAKAAPLRGLLPKGRRASITVPIDNAPDASPTAPPTALPATSPALVVVGL